MVIKREKVVELIKELLSTKKEIPWEPTARETAVRAKVNNYYIEIEITALGYIFRCFNYLEGHIHYVFEVSDFPEDKKLFVQLHNTAYEKVYGDSEKIINEMIAKLS